MAKAQFIKQADGSFMAATDWDREQFSHVKVNQSIAIEGKRQNKRSLQHHKLYWGGLVQLCLEYWQPTGGLIGETERKTLDGFAEWLGNAGGDVHIMKEAARQYLSGLEKHRSGKIPVQESNKEALSDWLKIHAGYYDVQDTPTGPVKKPSSISFSKMDQGQFNRFYSSVFNVAWRFILSREFSSEEAAQSAIDNLQAMG